MSKKNKSDVNGFVFSTDPSFRFEHENETPQQTLAPDKQVMKLKLDHKHRGGKTVTLLEGFVGKEEDLEALGKQLKNYCGTGGSAKDGLVIIQGDQREKMLQWLLKNNYKKVKKI